jgi:hypothetical protein
MRYVISGQDDTKPTACELRQHLDGSVSLVIGEWHICEVTPEGRLRLFGGIDRTNREQLCVDLNGQIEVIS